MESKTLNPINKVHLGWLICGIASLFYFYEFTQITVFNSLAEQIMERFSIDATQLSNLSAMYYYTNVLFLIPAGVILDRYSTKLAILITMAISIIGTIIFILAPSIAIAELGRALSGVGGAFAFIGNIRLITRWLPPQKIALGIASLVTVGFLGGIIAQIPFTLLKNHINYQDSLFILVGFGILFWVLIACFVKEREKSEVSEIQLSQLGGLLKTTLKNSQSWFCGWYISLMNLPIIILAALWSNLYLEEGDKLSSLEAASITSLLFVGVAIGSPVVGWLSGKMGSKKPLMLISAMLSFLALLALLYTGNSLIEIALLFLILGFVSSSQCLGYPAIVENNPPAATAIASSIASIIVLGGGALLKVLFGFVLDLFWGGKTLDAMRVYSKQDFNTAFYLLLICFALAFIFALFIKEKKL